MFFQTWGGKRKLYIMTNQCTACYITEVIQSEYLQHCNDKQEVDMTHFGISED